MKQLPKVIAHRGFSGKYPENTMIAFEKAISEGKSDGIELDIHLTKDQKLVVIHDDTLERTTTGQGAIYNFTYEELSTLDAGVKYAPEFAGEKIPLLEEVLELALKKNFVVNIELKYAPEEQHEPMAQKVIAMVREKKMEQMILFSSFNEAAIIYCAKEAPEIANALLYTNPIENIMDFCAIHNIKGINPHFKNVEYNNQLVRAGHQNGLKINVWTVNEQGDMGKMIDREVDSIITNYPDDLVKLLSRYSNY